MKVSWVQGSASSSDGNVFMTYHYELISSCICLCSSYDYAICYRKHWRPNWSSYINSEMAPVVFLVIKTITSHIRSKVRVVYDLWGFASIAYIGKWCWIIERSWDIIRNRNLLKSSRFVLIFCFCPVWNIGNRHDSSIKWISMNLGIAIRSRVHVRNPWFSYCDSSANDTVTCPYSHDGILYPGHVFKGLHICFCSSKVFSSKL